MNLKDHKALVYSGAGSLCFIILNITFLISEGKDPSQIIGLVSPVFAIVVVLLGNAAQGSKTQKKVDEVSSKVDVVGSNVNGHLSDLARAAGIPHRLGDDGPDDGTPTP